MSFRQFIVGIFCMLTPLFANIGFTQPKLNTIQIDNPVVRASAPGQMISSAYFKIQNKSNSPDRLVGVSFPKAKEVQLHEMKMDMDRMMMRQVSFIEVPANGTVELRPGGYHLMLMGLDSPIKESEQLKMTLQFEKAGKIEVTFTSQSMSSMHKH